jgi:hypothetical protein
MTLLSKEYWGPHLWVILHTLSEKSGQFKLLLQENDEAHAWIGLIRCLVDTMPCAKCVSHYKKFCLKHNIQTLLSLRGSLRKEWLQEFWHGLHNEINKENDKEAFDKANLSSKYNDRLVFQHSLSCFYRMTSYGVETGNLKLLGVKNATKQIELLRRYYSL